MQDMNTFSESKMEELTDRYVGAFFEWQSTDMEGEIIHVADRYTNTERIEGQLTEQESFRIAYQETRTETIEGEYARVDIVVITGQRGQSRGSLGIDSFHRRVKAGELECVNDGK